VIVRISGEGQYRLPDDHNARLNELDNDAVAAVEAGDEERFAQVWAEMIALVESQGEEIPDDELVGSDCILPPRDIEFAEARSEFTGEGLIPD
jgi:hypothetical protein